MNEIDNDDNLEPVEVEDEAANDEAEVLPTYAITAFGADFDVVSLVGRLERKDIEIPPFQRDFIWNYRQASRFVESLLLGFPVPGIFLWRDPRSERLVVVDGQQRLRTLAAYYRGVFKKREFVLPEKTSDYQEMNPRFQGRNYEGLDEEDRRRLDNSVIHATIVQQERPPQDDSSIFYLFERINTEGTPLTPQEIRSAIYQGSFVELLAALNQLSSWREVYGPPSPRLKDRELILRFFALYEASGIYARPMKEFLNRYFRDRRDLDDTARERLRELFTKTIDTVYQVLPAKPFRPVGTLNAAVFDGVMVGLANRLATGPFTDIVGVRTTYEALIVDKAFVATYSKATADKESVMKRLELATAAFAPVE